MNRTMKRLPALLLAMLILISALPGGWLVTLAAEDTETPDNPAPAVSTEVPVLSLTNVASSGKIKVTWNDIGAEKYEIYRATSKNGTYSLRATKETTSYINTATTAGKTYYYKVRALYSDGKAGEFSAIKYRTCDLPRPVVKVSNISSSGKVKLTWDAIDGAVSYKIYRATEQTGTYSLMKTTTDTKYTNTSAKAGVTYYYKVKAIAEKSAADSAYSTVVSRICRCAKPVITSAEINASGQPVLTWNAVDGAVSYKVYRATSADGSYKLMKTVTTGTSYTNTNVTNGTKYYYKVKAICADADGNSVYSEVVNVKAFSNSRVSLSKTNVTVDFGGEQTITATVTSSLEDFTIVCETDNESVAVAEWGDWNGNKLPLTIFGEWVGTTTINIYLAEEPDRVLATIKVTVNMSDKALYILAAATAAEEIRASEVFPDSFSINSIKACKGFRYSDDLDGTYREAGKYACVVVINYYYKDLMTGKIKSTTKTTAIEFNNDFTDYTLYEDFLYDSKSLVSVNTAVVKDIIDS